MDRCCAFSFVLDWPTWLFCAGYALLLVCIIVCITYWLVKREAQKEVDITPRVPMNDCDKHGLYPKSAAFRTTAIALGRPDLEVEICPFCYDDQMTAIEKQLEDK